MRNIYIVSLPFLFLYSGCAFVPREVDVSRIESRIIYPRQSFGAKEAIEFGDFVDKRLNKDKLGVGRNKLMMATTSISLKGDFQSVVERMVKQNFAAHGIGEATSPYMLSGSIVEAQSDAWGPDHIFVQIQVSLTMIDTRDNSPIFHKVLKGYKITPVTQLSNSAWEDAFIGAINQISEQVQSIASETFTFLKNSERFANIPSNTSKGTGFCVSPEGHLITAYHVIKNAKLIRVYLSKDSFVIAEILHSDPVNDLAVLKIEDATPSFLTVAPMRSVKTGDRVFTMGFPVSSVLGQEAKYTEGVVSSLSGIQGSSSFLQITVPIQPGNSGSPLVNEKGEVVGIVTSTAAILPFIKESGSLPQNVNWAVKADYLRPLIELPKAEQKQLNREQAITLAKKSTFLIEAE